MRFSELSLPTRTALASALPVAAAGITSLSLAASRAGVIAMAVLAVVVTLAVLLAYRRGRAEGAAVVRSLASATERVEALARSEAPDVSASMIPPAGNAPGEPFPALSEALDAVARRRAEMEADRRRAITGRLEAARLRSFVLAGVSHDLRGPLNSVLGFAGLLLEGIEGPVSAGQRESLEAVARGGRSLLQRIDDLLDAARLDVDRLVLDPAEITLGALLALARDEPLHRLGGAADSALA